MTDSGWTTNMYLPNPPVGNRVHPTALIHPNVFLDASVQIEPYCIIGSDHGSLALGPGTIVRAHTTIEGGSIYGAGLETGHNVYLRSGNHVGRNLRIGSYSSLEGGGEIGDYVRIHGRCEMTKGIIRHFARVYGGTYITDNRLPPSNVNEPAILDEGSVVAMNCVVIAGVTVGLGSFVGASTVVAKDVPPGAALIGGRTKPVTELHWADYYSYPWTSYYRDGYPPEAFARLDALDERIKAAAAAL